MPELERPDGARIHYEVRGDGPLVVLALGFATTPEPYAGLADDLARDHRLVTYDPRGCGESSADGPFDMSTDAADLAALIEEIGPPATVFAVAHGVNVATRSAADNPGIVHALVSPGVAAALVNHLEGTEGFAASRPVIELLVEQLRRDPRAAMRATIASLNPQLDDDALRERIEATADYSPVPAMLARIESWLEDDAALGRLRDAGDGLAVLWHGHDPWQAGAMERVAELLPDARIIEVEDGPLSRPDLAATVVREMT